MLALAQRLLAPYLLHIVIGLAIAGGVTAVYFKIRHDAVAEERARVEQEKQDAIDDARKAKDRLRRACDSNPDQCVRDDWFRD